MARCVLVHRRAASTAGRRDAGYGVVRQWAHPGARSGRLQCGRLRCRPSAKGSPTPAKVGVEKVPNVLSVHLIGLAAIVAACRREEPADRARSRAAATTEGQKKRGGGQLAR